MYVCMYAHFCSFLRKMKRSTAEAGGPPPVHKDLKLEDNETLCKVPLFGLFGPLQHAPTRCKASSQSAEGNRPRSSCEAPAREPQICHPQDSIASTPPTPHDATLVRRPVRGVNALPSDADSSSRDNRSLARAPGDLQGIAGRSQPRHCPI